MAVTPKIRVKVLPQSKLRLKFKEQKLRLRAVPAIPGAPGDDGDDGTAATIAVGSVTTLAPGAPATVTNSGTSLAAVFDFGIPAGEDGAGAVESVNGATGVVVIDAGDIANTPAGNIAATTVQAAIDELDTEKAAASHTHTASQITDFSTAADARITAGLGSTIQAYSADLASWAGITRASGFDTFVATPSWTNFLALVTGEPTFYTSGGTDVSVADGGTGRSTSTTAYGLIAAGTTATGAHQTLAAGTTSQILVGGGASALPVWTTATGTGSPVRATSPTLVTPVLGTPSSGTLTSCTGLPIVAGTTGTLTETRGGTNQTTYTTGDILYASAANTLSKLAAGTAGYTLQTNGAAAPTWVLKREVLTAARTYYVRSDGSDSNTGLTNSSGGAFLTLQKAFDVAATLDLGSYDVTIKIGNTATLTGALSCNKPILGGNLILEGDTSTPANTIVSVTSADAVAVSNSLQLTVKHVELRTTTSGSCLVAQGPGAKVIIGAGVRFGACANYHVRALSGGFIQNGSNNYNITGAAQNHYSSVVGGAIELSGSTVTITGTPAFSASFARADTGGLISAFSMTFSGSATGQRYNAATNGVIQTYGGGASYFPGNSAGATATGGQYA